MDIPIQRALISVSDKSGIVDFARGLSERGVELLSTGGTYKQLAEAGIAVREVSEHTGFPEMMDGRLKTLHPKVHGGLLALRDEASHRQAMEEHGIAPIDLAVINLYPFEETIARAGVTREQAVEQIDIGGPTMVRSAAKNHRFVGIVTDPGDYERVLAQLAERGGQLGLELRRELAQKAFALTARYDALISRWLYEQELADGLTESAFAPTHALAGVRELELRYGENPHQAAAFYRTGGATEASIAGAELLGGKALSYNNLVDLDAALALAKEFGEPFVAVTKHNNPCGAAAGDTLVAALEAAWDGDPVSAFGSVLAFTRPLDTACADFLTSSGRFVEAIVAPSFEPAALEILQTRPKWGQNVRLLACGPFGPDARSAPGSAGSLELKQLVGGFLLQQRDLTAEPEEAMQTVTKAEPSAEQKVALAFANRVAKHVKSNAIVLARGTQVVGVGAGQMSRVDAVELAVKKAGDRARGAVLASDAFFPFADGPQAAIEAGVTAILEPGGSRRDDEVIAACDERGIAMVFTGARHFRH